MLADLFLLQLGCAVVFLTYRSIGVTAVGVLWFLGGFAALSDLLARIDRASDEALPARLRSGCLRVVSLLIGANFGAFLGVFVGVAMLLSGMTDDLMTCIDVAKLVCLLLAVAAGSLVFLGRRLQYLSLVLVVLLSP